MVSRDGISRGAVVPLAAAILLGLAGRALARPVQLTSYQVEAGDTLYAIAARELGSGARWTAIARLNGLTDGTGLRPGQVLRLPAVAAGLHQEPDHRHSPLAPAFRSRQRSLRLPSGVEIVPRGRIVMVLPAPMPPRRVRRRIEHAETLGQGAELPSLAGSGRPLAIESH